MEETIGAATEERTRDSVDDRQQEETAEKMRRDRQLQFLTNWVSEHKVRDFRSPSQAPSSEFRWPPLASPYLEASELERRS